ncbi:hypothetical protein KKF04_02215, partial [Patescibacteria group bacterium]|nr:hypothetical protein [Patescibacteria group bacterium]
MAETQKEQLKTLEKDIKLAFKENRYEEVSALAEKIKAINPENRLVVKLLGKIEKTKADLEKKNKAQKAKEYEIMLNKLYKEKNYENLGKLIQEFKEFSPENKTADKWQAKLEKATKPQEKKEPFYAKWFKKTPARTGTGGGK